MRWLPRWLTRRRRDEDVEPYDDWPMCPDRWVRFETRDLLDAHWLREPDCGPPA